MAHRIVVRGGSGAGKSTLAQKLAHRLGVPYIELDALHHGPNWTAASAAELQARVLAVLNDNIGWVVDGNYDNKLENLVVDRAELVIWLDLPLQTKLLRLVHRTARRWFRNEELWNGNRENLREAFWGGEALFPWAIRSHFHHRSEWPQRFDGRRVVRLRSSREAEQWLTEFSRHPNL